MLQDTKLSIEQNQNDRLLEAADPSSLLFCNFLADVLRAVRHYEFVVSIERRVFIMKIPEEILALIQKYGSEVYNDVAVTSALKGKEISGYLYSPFFFRRWVPLQFERSLRLWWEIGRSVQNLEDAMLFAGKLPRILYHSFFGCRLSFDNSKELVDAYVECSQDRHRDNALHVLSSRMPLIAKYKRLREIPVSGYSNFAECLGSVDHWDLREALTKYSKEIYSDSPEKAGRISYSQLVSAERIAMYIRDPEFYGCDIVRGDYEFFEIDRAVKRDRLWRHFIWEIQTIAALEARGGYEFEDRSQFYSLDAINEALSKSYVSYAELLSALQNELFCKDVLTSTIFRGVDYTKFKDFCTQAYIRSGYAYWMRYKLAFMQSATKEELDTSTAEILNLSYEELVDRILDIQESELMPERPAFRPRMPRDPQIDRNDFKCGFGDEPADVNPLDFF